MSAARAPPMAYAPIDAHPTDGVDRVPLGALLDPARPRAVLALASTDGPEVDWALSRLLQLSHQAPAPGFQLHHLPDLIGLLVVYPIRLVHALAGHSPALWTDANSASDSDSDSDASSDVDHDSEAPSGRETSGSPSFSPATNDEHSTFLRRALEATVILRNAAFEQAPAPGAITNSHLISRSGILGVVPLALNLYLQQQTLLPTRNSSLHHPNLDQVAAAGLNELVLNLLDLIESFADSLRADVSQGFDLHRILHTLAFGSRLHRSPHGAAVYTGGTSDRSMLICALRILTKMASQPNNAAAFHENIPVAAAPPVVSGELASPGPDLDQHWPLTWQALHLLLVSHDADLLESTLELLHELVVVARNGLCLAAYPGLREREDIPQLPASPTAVALAVLLRCLTVLRTEWDRETPLVAQPVAPDSRSTLPRATGGQSRHAQPALEDQWKRAAHQAAAAITPSNVRVVESEQQETASQEGQLSKLLAVPSAGSDAGSPIYRAMRLTEQEAGASFQFASLDEAQLARCWLTTIFEPEPLALPSNSSTVQAPLVWEVSQMAYCAAYKDSVALVHKRESGSARGPLSVQELLNLPTALFHAPGPHLAPTRQSAPSDASGQSFVVRGIRVRIDRLLLAVRQVASDPTTGSGLQRLCTDWLQTYLARASGAPAWARAGATDPAHRSAGACLWASCRDPGSGLDKHQIQEHLQRHVAEVGDILAQPPSQSSSEAHDRFVDAHHCLWSTCSAVAPRGLGGRDARHWLERHVLTHVPLVDSPSSRPAEIQAQAPGLPIGASWTDENELRAAQSLVPNWVSPLDQFPGLAHWLSEAPIVPPKRRSAGDGQDLGSRKRVRLSSVEDDDDDDSVVGRYLPLHEPVPKEAQEPDANVLKVPWYLEPQALALSHPLRTEKTLGNVKFVVARTPLTGLTPTGCAATAALLLRAVTAQVSELLGVEDDEHDLEQQQLAERQQQQLRALTKDQASLVGFPFAPATAPPPRRVLSALPSPPGPTTRGPSGPSYPNSSSLEHAVARTWIDTLLDAETYVVFQSASNDVLSGILQDALACLPLPRTRDPKVFLIS